MASSNPLRPQNNYSFKGSPVSNQFTNLASPQPSSTGSPYLPNYLLGNPSPSGNSTGYGVLLSKNTSMGSHRQLSRSPSQTASKFIGYYGICLE